MLKKNNIVLKPSEISALLLFAVYFSLFFLFEQNFANVDHAKLVRYGSEILRMGEIFGVNHFSYTAPDYPFINHHWLTGLVFYAVHSAGGFEALTILVMLFNLATVIFAIYHGSRNGFFWVVLLTAFFLVPLISNRNQPRPEMFSILFFVINISILHGWYQGWIANKQLLVLPLLQLLWVNLHILFYFTVFLQGTMLFQLIIEKEKRKHLRYFGIIFASSLIATLINPFFIKGVIYPFKIMGDIDYAVSENLSLLFHWTLRRDTTPMMHVELSMLLGALLIYFWLKNPRYLRSHAYLLIWLITFAVLFVWRVRAGIFYSYVVLLIISWLTGFIGLQHQKRVKYASILALGMAVLIAFNLAVSPFVPYHSGYMKPGLGIDKKLDGGANYFKKYGLSGPIFNNFDIGDYLIYHLFPDEKVFVDSRPEAYPAGFFSKKLLPAIEDHYKWLELDHEYKFNVIFLALHSQVSGLIKRLYYDDGWFMAYNDEYTIIFVRRKKENDHLLRNVLLSRKALSDVVEYINKNNRQHRYRLWD